MNQENWNFMVYKARGPRYNHGFYLIHGKFKVDKANIKRKRKREILKELKSRGG